MNFYDSEWLSECCSSPPLFGLHHEEGIDSYGVCGSCREHATFLNEEGE